MNERAAAPRAFKQASSDQNLLIMFLPEGAQRYKENETQKKFFSARSLAG